MVDCSSNETLAHIVAFTVRHIPDGVKMLLEVDFFKIMLKSFRNRQKDLHEQKALLMIVAEVLSHDGDQEIAEEFLTSEWPDTCLELLKTWFFFNPNVTAIYCFFFLQHRYSDSQNDAEALLKAAAIHLLILFCGDTEEGLNFLKDNLEIILRNYDRSLEIYLLQKYDDDPRNQTVINIIRVIKHTHTHTVLNFDGFRSITK